MRTNILPACPSTILFRKDFLEVRIFYEELNVEKIEQKSSYRAGDLLGERQSWAAFASHVASSIL